MVDKKITRRSCLRKIATGAIGAAAFPYIIPASAMGKNGAVLPSERITVAQIGLGWIGGSHLDAILGRKDAQYVAICDVNKQKLQSVRDRINNHYRQRFNVAEFNGCDIYGDFREMLGREDIDAVIIATPDHWHAIMSIHAAKAGKDIYCEKPLTLTIQEAGEVMKVVRRYGTVFQTGSQQRSNSFNRFRDACELVRNGRVGKVVSVDVSTGNPPIDCDLQGQPEPDYFDWDMWVGQTPWRPYHEKLSSTAWRPYREYCGGGFADMGAHHFDIAQWGLDMDHSGPVEVLYPGIKNKDKISYRYANGVIMNHVGGNCLGLTFYGTDGSLYIGRDGLHSTPANLARDPLSSQAIRLYHSNNHHGNWLDCIRSRKRCVADVEIGARSAIACHMGNIAYQLKRSLKWDPENLRFIDDELANRLTTRSQRAPWSL